MASIWIIESGEYYDYRVDGIFSTRENAEIALSIINSGKIVERVLNPRVEELNKGYSSGKVEKCHCYNTFNFEDSTSS